MTFRKTIYIIFFVLLSQSVNAQTLEEKIQKIRTHFYFVNNHLSEYDVKVANQEEESTEGGEITCYLKDGKPVKISVSNFWEMGMESRDYYLKEGKLLFVFDQEVHYNVPMYMDSVRAVREGFNQWLDPKKFERRENRYYLYDDQLIRWINEQGEEVPSTQPGYYGKQNWLLKSLEELKLTSED